MTYSAKLFMINLSENFLGFYDRLAALNEAKYSRGNLNDVFAALCTNLSVKASLGAIMATFSLEESAAVDSADYGASQKVKATIRTVVSSDRELGGSVKDVLNSLFDNYTRVISLGFKSACEQELNDSFARYSISVDDLSETDFETSLDGDGTYNYDMRFNLTFKIIVNAFAKKYSFVYEKISLPSDFTKAGDRELSAGQFNTLKARLASETRKKKVDSVEKVLQFYVNAFISECRTKQLLQDDAFITAVNKVLQSKNAPKRLDIACRYDFADQHADELDVGHSSGNQADIKATAASANKNAISRIEVKILGANSLIENENIHDAEIVFVYRLGKNKLEIYSPALTKLCEMPIKPWPEFIRVSKISESQDGYVAHIYPW